MAIVMQNQMETGKTPEERYVIVCHCTSTVVPYSVAEINI